MSSRSLQLLDTFSYPERCMSIVRALNKGGVGVLLSQEQTSDCFRVCIESLEASCRFRLIGEGPSLHDAYDALHAQLLDRMEEQLPQHEPDSILYLLYTEAYAAIPEEGEATHE